MIKFYAYVLILLSILKLSISLNIIESLINEIISNGDDSKYGNIIMNKHYNT